MPSPSVLSTNPSSLSRDVRLLFVAIVGLLAMAPLAYLAMLPDEKDEFVDLADVRVGYLPDASASMEPPADAKKADLKWLTLAEVGAQAERSPYWLQLPVANPQSHRVATVLEVFDLYVDHIEFFEEGSTAVVRTGQEVALNERSVRSHLPAVQVMLEPGETKTFWVRSTGQFDAPPPMRVWTSSEGFRRYEQRQVLALTLYFGLWGALFIYNFFVFLVLRENTVLWYLAYLLPFGGLVAVGTNFCVNFFPTPPSGLPREVSLYALLMASCLTMLQFSRAFLETRKISPRADRFLQVLVWATGLALLFSPALLEIEVIKHAWKGYYPLVLLSVIGAPCVGIYLWIKRVRQAPLYVLAFACVGGALVWMLLAQMEILPTDQTNGAPFIIGSALEILLLAIAVAFRYRLIREEKEQLQANYTSQLAREVDERTRELLALSQTLSQSNADKDRLISIIAHDVRAPLASMLAVYRVLPADQLAAHTEHIKSRCADLLELVNNLLEWARLRTGQLPREQAALNLAGLVETSLRSLKAAAQQKGVTLTIDVPFDLELFADGHAVQSILRNIVGNAVKFTPSGGAVTLSAYPEGKWIELRVDDTGVGMPEDRLAALRAQGSTINSVPGTQGEAGAGVGMGLVRELVTREGGSLEIDSAPGVGTTVRVRFSLAASA